jgi:hypothetical protein
MSTPVNVAGPGREIEAMSNACRSRHSWLPPVLWLCVIGWAALHATTLRHLLAGPFAVEATALVAEGKRCSPLGTYVRIDVAQLEPAAAYSYSLGKDPYLNYRLLPIGNNRLLVLLPADHETPQIDGIVEPLSTYEQRHLVPRLRQREPAAEFLPYRLNASRPLLPFRFLLTVFPVTCVVVVALYLTGRDSLAFKRSKLLATTARTPQPLSLDRGSR